MCVLDTSWSSGERITLRGIFLGDDDEVGYYDDDDYDDGRTNCADGAIGSEAFDSCWDLQM